MKELYILCVYNCYHIKWHIVDYNIINTSYLLIKYFEDLYGKDIILEVENKNIKYLNIHKYIELNPYRLCLKLYD